MKFFILAIAALSLSAVITHAEKRYNLKPTTTKMAEDPILVTKNPTFKSMSKEGGALKVNAACIDSNGFAHDSHSKNYENCLRSSESARSPQDYSRKRNGSTIIIGN